MTITGLPRWSAAELGQQVQIMSTAAADAGAAPGELVIDREVPRADQPPSRSPASFSVTQSRTPMAKGEVTVGVVGYDAERIASEPAMVTLRMVAGAAEVMPTPSGDVSGRGGCSLNASVLDDVTVPEGMQMSPQLRVAGLQTSQQFHRQPGIHPRSGADVVQPD